MQAKLLNSYKWNLSCADSLSKQNDLNYHEIQTICEYMGKCKLIVSMFKVDFGDASLEKNFDGYYQAISERIENAIINYKGV